VSGVSPSIHRCLAGLVAAATLFVACTSGGDTPPEASAPSPAPSSSTAVPDTDPGTGPGAGCDGPNSSSDGTDNDADLDPDLDERWRTAAQLGSVESFEELAAEGIGGQSVVKFSILNFFDDPAVEWLDSDFYALHDEWFWFRLLNGARFDGVDVEPIIDRFFGGMPADGFDNVAAVYDWADANRDRLPLDLRFTSGDRLYSPQFYDLALDDPDVRPLALGSVIRRPAAADCSTPERWLLELEFRDDPTPEQVARYLDIVGSTLPDGVGDQLLWVPRSREQELTADAMRDDALPAGERTIRFDELVEPGTVEVYSPGVAAGRLLLVTDDGPYSLSDAGPDDIVVVERTPDYLPPGRALITGTPQTPLAHVNVLAVNRGIPNAFLGGLVDNADLNQLGRVRAPVVVRVVGDELDVRPLTADEFDIWRDRQGTSPIAVPDLDLAALPLTIDIDTFAASRTGGQLTESELDELRPVIGGKAAGFFGLGAPGTVKMPDRPLAITVRAYFEHIARLDAEITAMLSADDFQQSSRARYIVLEGADDFADDFDSPEDEQYLSDFLEQHTEPDAVTALGAIVDAGGLKDMIRDLPVDVATLGAITAELEENFGDLSALQGLRFRSSSSVEDIEGFNGAGLYSSNTGFIDPTALPDVDDHDRTVERALQRTWGSYWNAEAVEERYTENVDHRSGAMAVLVHPRFDDELEISNGVATFTLLPPRPGEPDNDQLTDMAVLRLNVQAGDTSVTNPDNEPGQTPEVVELRMAASDDGPRVERTAASSLVPAGDDVLDDEQLVNIWQQLRDVTETWRDRINAALPRARQITTLTLDFEFREMAAAWPAQADGSTAPTDQIVVKQARTLEPGLRGIPEELLELDAPRDVLARTVRAERVTCPSASGADEITVELFTDPLASVDMGYSTTPLTITESGTSTRLVDDTCTRTSAFSSADDYLLSLFDTTD